MNKQSIEIIGRVVQKPEVQKSKSDKEYSRVSVAVNVKEKNTKGEFEEKANFFDVLLFGKRAVKSSNLEKGMLIRALGPLSIKPYTSKKKEARVELAVFADEFYVFNSEVFK
ncbi:MAG: single-stranded DNA-binding protein [Candidatus Dojkabacteria bacterium]|jgi:single-strand DNA-binding protein|nr:single-stranded DNA-binding protein [Candidatus Dojkabacteria bacterium]